VLLCKKGAIRELNPGPPVPKTGIIPLDQSPLVLFIFHSILSTNNVKVGGLENIGERGLSNDLFGTLKF
jgi:hypothetical protein